MKHCRFFATSSVRRRRALGLVDYVAILLILAVLAAVLYPVFAVQHTKSPSSSCASNEKQIGLALLSYCQDFDDRLPPASQYSRDAVVGKQISTVSVWGEEKSVAVKKTDTAESPTSLSAYVKNAGIFVCPSTLPQAHFTYILNDLAAAAYLTKDFAKDTVTVMVAEDGG